MMEKVSDMCNEIKFKRKVVTVVRKNIPRKERVKREDVNLEGNGSIKKFITYIERGRI